MNVPRQVWTLTFVQSQDVTGLTAEPAVQHMCNENRQICTHGDRKWTHHCQTEHMSMGVGPTDNDSSINHDIYDIAWHLHNPRTHPHCQQHPHPYLHPSWWPKPIHRSWKPIAVHERNQCLQKKQWWAWNGGSKVVKKKVWSDEDREGVSRGKSRAMKWKATKKCMPPLY